MVPGMEEVGVDGQGAKGAGPELRPRSWCGAGACLRLNGLWSLPGSFFETSPFPPFGVLKRVSGLTPILTSCVARSAT